MKEKNSWRLSINHFFWNSYFLPGKNMDMNAESTEEASLDNVSKCRDYEFAVSEIFTTHYTLVNGPFDKWI